MRKLRYLLQLSSAGFKRGLQVATTSVKTFHNKSKGFLSLSKLAFRKLGSAIGKQIKRGVRVASNSIKSFGSLLKRVFTSPLALIGSMTIAMYKLGSSALEGARHFRTLEQEFANINTLLSENEQLTEKTKKSIRELSKTYGTDAKQNLQAYYDAVSAGIKGEDKRLEVTEQANKLALAGKSDIATAQSAMLTLMQSYGVSAQKASDWLIQVVKQGRTTLGKLAPSIGKVADLANKAGVDFNELGAFIAEATKSGQETSEVMSAIRQVLANIVKQTPMAVKALEQLGIEGFNVAGIRAEGFTNKMNELYRATNKFQNLGPLSEIFGSVEGLGSVLTAVPGLQQAKTVFEDAILGATDRAFKKVENTIQNVMNKIKMHIKDVWGEAGEAVNGFILLLKKAYLEISKVAVKLINEVYKIVQGVDKSKFKALFQNISNQFSGFIKNVVKGIKDFFNDTQRVQKVVDNIADGFNAIVLILKTIASIISGINTVINSIVAGIDKIGDKLIGDKILDAQLDTAKGSLARTRLKSGVAGPINPLVDPNVSQSKKNELVDLSKQLSEALAKAPAGTVKIEFKGDAKDLLQAKFEKSGQNKTLNTKSFDPTKDTVQ